MIKRFMVLIFLLILLTSCQNQVSENITWGSKHSISLKDINRIDLQMADSSVITLPQEEMVRYMNAISSGVFDKGQLDLRPSDYTVELILKSGEKKKLSIWLSDGANLFTDHDDTGHYILDEKARTTIMGILDEIDEL